MRKVKRIVGVILLGFCSAFWDIASSANTKLWPDVLPLKQSIYFSNTSQFAAGLYIFGVDGNPRYLIECHDNRYEEDKGFLYSGDFECRLTPLYERTRYSTLFTDESHQSRDWQSRARFLSQELMGKCASYPEYGAVRHFRLRKMDITLAMHDVRFRAPGLGKGVVKGRSKIESFRFDIEVTSDSTAESEIAEPVRYQHPPYMHPNAKDDFTLDCTAVFQGSGIDSTKKSTNKN